MALSRLVLAFSLLLPLYASAQPADATRKTERVLTRLDGALDLEDEQRDRLREVLNENGGKLRAPQVREVLAQVLTSEQQAALREAFRNAAGKTRKKAKDLDGVRVTSNVRYVERPGAAARGTQLDLYAPVDGHDLPVLLFVHGGGWKKGDKNSARPKGNFFATQGFLFASANYRLAPSAQPSEQADDVVAALAWIRDHAAEHGGDPERVFLMGHSAGAHLAALAAVDAERLGAVGLSLDSLDGVVLLDGAGYDVPRQINELATGRNKDLYLSVFGEDPSAWPAVSPALRVTAQAAPFLILHVAKRRTSRLQSEGLAAALTAKGGKATVVGLDKTHATINRDVGKDLEDPLTAKILAFLKPPESAQ
jgi:arylformamidase